MTAPRAVLRLTGVVKTYPGVVALKGVTFEVAAGEVHALVGENGAGKSTLMAVAAGSTLPDRGSVEIGGRLLADPSPAGAQRLGLAVVYQHLSILEDLTVTENMVFAMPRGHRPSMSSARAWTGRALAAVGAGVDPSARVNSLSTADRQLLEIAKALALESNVLVLDEPTESLTGGESERLFEQIRRITRQGTAVVYISHRLPEVKGIADRITVLRDGETRGTFAASAVSEDEILALIIGRAVEQAFPDKPPVDRDAGPVLRVRGLTGPGFRDVSFDVHEGEIVGLAGVVGNGQLELLRALAGLAAREGEVLVDGGPVGGSSPRRAHGAGVVYLPGDRHREGILLSLGVRENVSLLALDDMARAGVVQRGLEARAVSDQIAQLAIKTPSAETPASSLSGGNQQKVLFARSLIAAPRVLLADEPTRGVDAGARLELYRVLRGAADGGKAVIVLSTDAVELQGLCDRVLVFSRGEVVRELAGEAITEEEITGAAITSAARHRPELAHRAGRRDRLRQFLTGDYLPSAVLLLLILALGAFTSAENGRFFTQFNFLGMLLLASALVFISLGQQTVLLLGGIDLSVGPLAGLVVVVLSFFVAAGQGPFQLTLGILAVLGTALAAGLTNGLLIRALRLSPVLATLSTYTVIQGISLLLRPQPEGFFRPGVTAAVKTSIGWVPVAFIAAAAVTLVCELLLRRSRAGLELRAVGSDETRAHRLGARVNATHLLAYVVCALFAAAGGILLSAQVAVGDPSLGVNYTLTSIIAVVLGGTSIFGGRGSYVGAFLGAVLIQELVTSPQFLQGTFLVDKIGFAAFSQWLLGILILVGAGVYSRARGIRSAALEAGSA